MVYTVCFDADMWQIVLEVCKTLDGAKALAQLHFSGEYIDFKGIDWETEAVEVPALKWAAPKEGLNENILLFGDYSQEDHDPSTWYVRYIIRQFELKD
jgi:hypothetical protein